MTRIEVAPVQSNRQRKEFLNLPGRIYSQDPHWIPPLNANIKEMVNFVKHPFYNTASVQTFVASRGTEVVGRIAAIDNPGHVERYQEPLGFWGFLETVDDTEVANRLFEAVRDWFAKRGIQQLRGPCNPSLNYECGLLVEGFDSSPTFMMTYNPPYYGPLVEQAGFQKCQDLFAFWGHVRMLKELDKKLEFVVNEATRRFNVTTRRLDRSRFKQEVRLFLDIYNKSLVNTWGFVPLSDAELDHLAASLKHLIVPEMTSIAEVDGQPIGAMFGLLDYNPRIRDIKGRLFPFGFIKLLGNRRGIKKVRLVSTNVLPEYQKWGIGLVLVSRIVPDVIDWGIEEAEFSWVLESNHLSRSTLERGGAVLQKRYRLYDSV